MLKYFPIIPYEKCILIAQLLRYNFHPAFMAEIKERAVLNAQGLKKIFETVNRNNIITT